MKNYIYILIVLSTLHAIGFDAVNIFNSPNDLALSGTGVASRNLIYNSPAISSPSISKDSNSIISFSANKWIQNFSGNSFMFCKDDFRLRFNSIGVEDIKVYDDTPSDSPLDIISSHYLSLGISKGFNLKSFVVGFGANFQYSQLFTEDLSEITFDVGLKKIFSDSFRAGVLAENLSNIDSDTPSNYGIGCSFYNSKINSEILLDYNYSSSYKGGMHIGLIQKIKTITLNGGYSTYDSRTSLSSGLKVNINNKYNFQYSILSLQNSNLGLSHYFGLEIVI